MLKKVIKFTDYDGNQREEEFFFHMNKAEVIEWLVTNGDYTYDKLIDQMSKKRDGKAIMGVFKDLIYRSYGEKSVDGRRFVKSQEVKDNFMETEAYSELFVELVTDAKKAADFLNGVIPKDLSDLVSETIAKNPGATPEELKEIIASDGSNVVTLPEKNA